MPVVVARGVARTDQPFVVAGEAIYACTVTRDTDRMGSVAD